MLGNGRNPFLGSDNMGRSHIMVVAGVGEMIGRNTVRFKQNLVDYVFGHLDFASDNIIKNDSFIFTSRGTQAKHPRLALGKILFDFFKAQIAAFCPFAEIASD